MEGVDYSDTRPDPASLKQAGKHFAVRYVGTPSSRKSLTRDEVRALQNAGIDIVATYETTAGFMLTENGRAAAATANSHALSCGMPSDRPIYFALDVDPIILTGAQWDKIRAFFSDAAGEIGALRCGVYGGYIAIDHLVGGGYARYGWQTYAWSNHAWSGKSHLQQYRNGVALAGGIVDLCRSVAADFGQWSYSPKPEQKKDDDMPFMVQSKDSGAVLLVSGSGSILIVSNAERDAHRTIGIPLLAVSGSQFRHYEAMREDVEQPPTPVTVNVTIDGDDLRVAIANALSGLNVTSKIGWESTP